MGMVKQVGSSGLEDNCSEETVEALMLELEVDNELRVASDVPLTASRGALSAALPKSSRTPPKPKATPKKTAKPSPTPKATPKKAAPKKAASSKKKPVPKDGKWERKKAACRARSKAIKIAKAEGKSKAEIKGIAKKAYAAIVVLWKSWVDDAA
jgi:outer membrane biosynthesis protein TonB